MTLPNRSIRRTAVSLTAKASRAAFVVTEPTAREIAKAVERLCERWSSLSFSSGENGLCADDLCIDKHHRSLPDLASISSHQQNPMAAGKFLRSTFSLILSLLKSSATSLF